MCTRILWTGIAGNKFSSVCGRNMDWGFDMEEKLWVFPAGLKRKSDVEGKFIGWTSKYGSIATSVYDQATSDGMNTEGLAIHANWLTEANYGARDESKPGLDGNRGVQYFLDNFATVREVVEHLEKNKDLQFVPTKIKKGSEEEEVQCHLAMEDAQGESVIIEYLKNGDENSVERNIYYSGDIPNYSMEYNVLTNSPPFKEQLLNLQKYEGFGGNLDLPGTTAAADRFVRGAFYLKSLPKPANQREAIAGVLSVMRSTAQPFRVPDPDKPYASSTRWRTVAALTEKLYLYESSLYPTLIWLDAKKIFEEDSSVRVFDLAKNREAIGDISDKLIPAEDLFGNNVSR